MSEWLDKLVELRAPRSMEVEYPIGLKSVMADTMSLSRSFNRILCWGEIAGCAPREHS